MGDPIEPEPVITKAEILPVPNDRTESPIEVARPVLAAVETVVARPVIAAMETAFAFVGNIQSPCSAYDIHTHITQNTVLNTKLSDIEELDTRGDKLAFKIAVPKNRLNLVVSSSLWGKGIKSEVYKPRRPKKTHSPKLARPNPNNRDFHRYKTFRDPNPTQYRHHRPPYSYDGTRYAENTYFRDQYQRPYGF